LGKIEVAQFMGHHALKIRGHEPIDFFVHDPYVGFDVRGQGPTGTIRLGVPIKVNGEGLVVGPGRKNAQVQKKFAVQPFQNVKNPRGSQGLFVVNHEMGRPHRSGVPKDRPVFVAFGSTGACGQKERGQQDRVKPFHSPSIPPKPNLSEAGFHEPFRAT
jgi:hypothetical protein